MPAPAAITKEQRNKGLDKVRELIERGWCQGWQARNGGGEKTAISASDASRVCIYGAVSLVASDDLAEAIHETLQDLLERRTGNREVSIWNDDPRRTQMEVAEFLEAAKSQRMPSLTLSERK